MTADECFNWNSDGREQMYFSKRRGRTVTREVNARLDPSELAMAVAYYQSARAEIAICLQTNEDIAKTFITASLTGIAASITSSALDIHGLSLLCCVMPTFSLPFALWRKSNSDDIVRLAEYIRLHHSYYIKNALPNLKSATLSPVSWETFTALEKRKEGGEWLSAFVIFHFPSLISLLVAGVTFISGWSHEEMRAVCSILTGCVAQREGLISGVMMQGLVITASTIIWFLAVGVTLDRLNTLKRAVSRHATGKSLF